MSMDIRTHTAIDHALSGAPCEVAKGRARVTLETTSVMAADDHGLVHGGFVFSLADHAAMLAINHPHVVLGSADTRFVAPVAVGDALIANAVLDQVTGKKHIVQVQVHRGDTLVFDGRFTCFTPHEHILRRRP